MLNCLSIAGLTAIDVFQKVSIFPSFSLPQGYISIHIVSSVAFNILLLASIYGEKYEFCINRNHFVMHDDGAINLLETFIQRAKNVIPTA